MLKYVDFYNLVEYCNENWKSKLSSREIAENAYELLSEFEDSKANRMCSPRIKNLIEELKADNSEESEDWIDSILDDIGEDALTRKEYKVRVVETYSRYVDVIAEDEDEAYEIVDEKVNNGEIDIPRDGGDYKYDRELFVWEANEK